MSINKLLLLDEYVFEYDLVKKKDYSGPTMYDGGGDLDKRWYVYYSFRNPETGYLERQPPIYSKINDFDSVRERRAFMKLVHQATKKILEDGYNPFTDEQEEIKVEVEAVNEPIKMTAKEAIEFALRTKKQEISDNSFTDFRVRIKSFGRWLKKKDFDKKDINEVNRQTCIRFLNEVLESTSPKNRNNFRSVLSMFFKLLEENEIIGENFIPGINILKAIPEKNKTFDIRQEEDIYNLAKADEVMTLFIKFVSYNFLRPVEVVRLKVKNINIYDRQLQVKAKNKPNKIKIIPEILLKDIPDLTQFDPESYLFTPLGFGQEWESNETSKRNYFGKRFKKIKKKLGLGKDYGMYSFRHTFITKLYRELVKGSTPFEAKSKLMLITGHISMGALEKYLREIDAELPEDYSRLLEK